MTIATIIQINGAAVRSLPPVTWTSGISAQNVLEQAYTQGSSYSYLLQYFGPQLGYEAMAFDGIAAVQGADVGFYWQLLLNGTPTPQGIDSTFPNDGDTLAFNYIVYNAETHAGTRLEAVAKAKAAHRPAS